MPHSYPPRRASECAALQASLRKLGEEALPGIEPGAGGRHEAEDEARVPVEPATHLGMLVGGIVIEDHVNDLARRDFGLDGVQEADELLDRKSTRLNSSH